jgi:hypothetical protein
MIPVSGGPFAANAVFVYALSRTIADVLSRADRRPI